MDIRSYIKVKNENGEFETIYPITNSDNIEIPDPAGNLSAKISQIDANINTKIDASTKGKADGIATLDANGFIPLTQLPKESKEIQVVENIAQLNAIPNPFKGLSVFVKDATGDVSVKSGGAFYIYDGNRFIKTAQAETMNVVVDFGNVENKPDSLEGYGIKDAVKKSDLVTVANSANAGKILVLNKNGELDVNITGRANSTSRLDTPRKITFEGDVMGEFLFDGGSNVSVKTELISKGIKPGEYTKVGVDEKGRIISVNKLLESDIPNLDWSKIKGTPESLQDYGINDQVMVRNVDQTMSAFLSLNKDPIDDTHAVNKKYVDSIAQGLRTKPAVAVATKNNITLYGLQVIGNVQLKENDRVLLFNQTNRTENGIYLAKPNAWVRSDDANEDHEYEPGMFVFVQYGEYEGCGFVLINENPVRVGYDDIYFTQFSGASDILAGSGINRDGNVLALETIGSPGEYIKVTVDKHGRVVYGKKKITEADIIDGISWKNVVGRPNSSPSALDDAVIKKHIHGNKTVLEKLSENEEGNLIYDGKEIATGPGGGGSLDGVITSVSTTPPEDLATGGIWFKILEK